MFLGVHFGRRWVPQSTPTALSLLLRWPASKRQQIYSRRGRTRDADDVAPWLLRFTFIVVRLVSEVCWAVVGRVVIVCPYHQEGRHTSIYIECILKNSTFHCYYQFCIGFLCFANRLYVGYLSILPTPSPVPYHHRQQAL